MSQDGMEVDGDDSPSRILVCSWQQREQAVFSEMPLCIWPSYSLAASQLTKATGQKSHQERQGSKLPQRVVAACLGIYFLKHGGVQEKHYLNVGGSGEAEIGNRQPLLPCVQTGNEAASMFHASRWSMRWKKRSWKLLANVLSASTCLCPELDSTVSLHLILECISGR